MTIPFFKIIFLHWYNLNQLSIAMSNGSFHMGELWKGKELPPGGSVTNWLTCIVFFIKKKTFQVSPLESSVYKVLGVFCSPTSTTLTSPNKRKATWLLLVPNYMLALGLLGIFYEKFHVWKKEGVVVGFVYDQIEACKENIIQQQFKGHWTSHFKESVAIKDSRGQSYMWELLSYWIAIITLLIVFINVESA